MNIFSSNLCFPPMTSGINFFAGVCRPTESTEEWFYAKGFLKLFLEGHTKMTSGRVLKLTQYYAKKATHIFIIFAILSSASV